MQTFERIEAELERIAAANPDLTRSRIISSVLVRHSQRDVARLARLGDYQQPLRFR